MHTKKVIGLGGTNGAGKDTVAHLLVQHHNFLFAGATEMFLDELAKRGWPADREHKSRLSAEWRREFGMGVIVDKGVAMLDASAEPRAGLVVGSLRHPGEAERVHELGGIMIWVDADPKLRYDRISANAAARGREAEDGKSFEDFMADEAREMQPEGDGATLNMAGVKALADITLINDSNDVTLLRARLEAALSL